MTRADGRTTASVRVRIPADCAYFDGHFPGYPVLAGAVQLQAFVLPCLRRVLGRACAPTELAGLKFPRRIRPGDEVEVRLVVEPGETDVAFELVVGAERCTHGRLVLGPRADTDAG